MGKRFLYGDTKLMAVVENIRNLFSLFFFFQSVQRSREGGLHESFLKPKQLSEINREKS